MTSRRARTVAWSMLAVAMTAAAPASAVTVFDFAEGAYAHPGGLELPFRLFVPPDYDARRAYPLILFLHGSGERGTNNLNQVTGQDGFLVFVEDAVQAEHPALLLAPQLPPDARWLDHVPTLLGLLDRVAADYTVDEDRVYATGLSLGGEGTWALLIEAPDRLAAAVPMSGLYRGEGDIAVAKDVPVWNVHAADDDVVPVAGSRALVDALAEAGGRVVYTELAVGGHVIWDAAYGLPGLVEWTFAQRRGAPAASPVGIALREPVSRSVDAASVALTGTATGLGAITQTEWRLGAGEWARLEPPTPWRVSSVELEKGANVVQVRAHDDAETTLYASFEITRLEPEPQTQDPDPSGCTTGAGGGQLGLLLLALGLGAARRRR